MFTRIAQAAKSAAATSWNYVKSSWNYVRQKAAPVTNYAAGTTHHLLIELLLPFLISIVRIIAGLGQAVFTQKRLTDYLENTKFELSNSNVILLNLLQMLGNFIVTCFTRVPTAFKQYNPSAFDWDLLLAKHFNRIVDECSLDLSLTKEAVAALRKYIFKHKLVDKALGDFLRDLLIGLNGNHNINATDIENMLQKIEQENKYRPNFKFGTNDNAFNSSITAIVSLFLYAYHFINDLVFPSDLNWKGKIAYTFLWPLNVISVFFQSISIIGFTKTFIQMLVPLIVYVLNLFLIEQLATPSSDDIENSNGVNYLSLVMFILNGISNVQFDLANAFLNAHLFAQQMQDPKVTWSQILNRFTIISAILALLTAPAIGALALFSTINNLSKIPFIDLPQSLKNGFGIVSLISSVVGLFTTKSPSVTRAFRRDLPKITMWTMKIRVLFSLFLVGLMLDSFQTLSGGFTAISSRLVNIIKYFNPDTETTDKSLSIIISSLISALCSVIQNFPYMLENVLKFLSQWREASLPAVIILAARSRNKDELEIIDEPPAAPAPLSSACNGHAHAPMIEDDSRIVLDIPENDNWEKAIAVEENLELSNMQQSPSRLAQNNKNQEAEPLLSGSYQDKDPPTRSSRVKRTFIREKTKLSHSMPMTPATPTLFKPNKDDKNNSLPKIIARNDDDLESANGDTNGTRRSVRNSVGDFSDALYYPF